MKRKHLIILLSLIFASLILLGYYLFISINYVPRAELVEESNIIENETTDNTLEQKNIIP